MKKTALFLVCIGVMSSCKPSEPDTSFSPAQQRQEKVARYLQEARNYDEKSKERTLPLSAAGITVPSASISQEDLRALPTEMLLRKQVLEDWLRASYGEEAAGRAGELILQYHKEAMDAVKTAKSPEEMADLLNQVELHHAQRLDAFVAQEQEKIWFRPNAVQLNQARLKMEQNVQNLLADIEQEYGAVCAEKAKPLLENLPQEGVKLIGAATSREELDTTMKQLFSQADRQIKTIILEYGDPAYSVPEKDLQQMRADMKKEYQPLEQKVSRLYGRRAVLQLRALFNQFMDGVTQVAQEKSRASEKEAKVSVLTKNYQSKVAGLQEELNRRLAAAKKKNTAAAKKKPSPAVVKNTKKKK